MYCEHSRKWHTCGHSRKVHTCGHSWTPPPCFQGIGLARLRTCSAVQEGTASPPSGYVTAKLTVWTGRMRRDVVSLRRYLGWNGSLHARWGGKIFGLMQMDIYSFVCWNFWLKLNKIIFQVYWTLQRGVGEIGVSVWFVTFITVLFKEVHWQIK